MDQNEKPGTADLLRAGGSEPREEAPVAPVMRNDLGETSTPPVEKDDLGETQASGASDEPTNVSNGSQGQGDTRPSREASAGPQLTAQGNEHDHPLVSDSEAGNLRDRWRDIQGKFVDEPQSAVEEADTLVVEVIQSVARRFADERQNLERQWHSGSDVSTEDLRLALQHYRSFFQRLLAA